MEDLCRDSELKEIKPPGYGSVVLSNLPEVGVENVYYIIPDDNIYMWNGEGFESICGGGSPSGTLEINENGTYDVSAYALADVDVPNSYSASDEGKVVSNGALVAQTSQTVTANDTYDTTLIDSLTVNVSGGGQVYTGTVELQNEDVGNLIIPVDISSGSAVVVAYVDRTGTIVDGNVVYDDEPIMPASTTNNNTMIWYAAAIKQCDNKNMKRDASNYTSIKRPFNMSYCYAYFGGNGAAIGLDANIVSGTNISLPASNGTRHWCKSGYYARWAYTVVVA